MLFRSKRGEEDLWNAMTLIAGAVVGIFFVMIIYRFGSTAYAEATFFTKDAALLTDAILATPQNIELVHTQQQPGKYARYYDGEFQLFTSSDGKKPNASQVTPFRNSFVPRKDITMDEELHLLSVVYFLKNSSMMTITNQPWDFASVQIEEAEEEPPAGEEKASTGTSEELEEQIKLYELYQEYLKTQILCFKTIDDCMFSVEKDYTEVCERFNCLCVPTSIRKIERCPADKPYYIVGLGAPRYAPIDPRLGK